MTSAFQWTCALSTRVSLEAAVQDAVERATAALTGPADLAIAFISSAFTSEYSRFMPLLKEALAEHYEDLPAIIGCGGGGVVGTHDDGRTDELEDEPALSLTLAAMPGAQVTAFHISNGDLPDLDSPPDSWSVLVGVDPQYQPDFVLLADPALKEINELLQGLDFAYPGSVKIGGLASGLSSRASRVLFHDYSAYGEGAVGVALTGAIKIDPIVAQGCRPIGKPFWVTECDRNIVLKVEEQNQPDQMSGGGDDRPPLFALRELIQTLESSDRKLAEEALFVGVARDEFRSTLEPGDFLIRNLLGVDPSAGAVAIGDRIRAGQRIQFHLRDASTSAEDLETLLQRYLLRASEDPDQARPVGALMFACLGRGEGLYGEPNFDSGIAHKILGPLPIGGFFCNGELGPVGNTTFVHGYTSVFGLIRPA
ncbi:MAG: FIST N-terminal domain-containing protein [Cyanobacteria bacterium P01_F01_bin.153]